MLEKIYTIDEIINIMKPIATKNGVKKMYLFGSYARGEATEKSDIDILIEKGKIVDLEDLAGLYIDITNTFNKEVDIITTDGLRKDFHNNIIDDEVLIFEQQY